jgi:hypothetical protein
MENASQGWQRVSTRGLLFSNENIWWPHLRIGVLNRLSGIPPSPVYFAEN